MKFIEVEVPAFRVVGISLRTSNARMDEIGAFFGRFFAEDVLSKIPGRADRSWITLYSSYESDHTGEFTMTLGAIVARDHPVPRGLVALDVPAQRYAVFPARGAMPAALVDTWQRVWTAPIERAFTYDFDAHDSAESVDVHVALRPSRARSDGRIVAP
jgi:predicted transcriptional regulator YdeE